MKKYFLLLLVAIATLVNAQKLPIDKAYRIGKLDNGLTYYIRHNNYPEHLANFYIAQRVGSIQEEDDQRGLAHFLEHMAFNGSTHFPENGIIEYCRSIGVAFGRDINAMTSIEQTVYNIDNVPTKRQSSLDSCLLVLQDWSNGLLLQPEEIDKERGVIHGEWAMRNNAMQRLRERNLPKFYPGCRYGERLPIGTMEIVDNFKPEQLRAYYEKWYHPENQAIIIVGDVDVDYTEAKIKEMFSGIKAGPNAAHVQTIQVPDNDKPIIIIDKDKEMTQSSMSLMWKCEPLPKEIYGTEMEYYSSYLMAMARAMFSARMQELAQNANSPFQSMSISYGTFMVSKPKWAFEISATSKQGKEIESLETMVREVRRVKEYGFTDSEYKRMKANILASIEKEYSARDKRTNTSFYRECLSNYLQGTSLCDVDYDYNLAKRTVENLTLDVVNNLLSQYINVDSDYNMVFMLFGQDKEGITLPTSEQVMNAITASRAAAVQPWEDKSIDKPLMSSLPKAGKIKSEKDAPLGFRELTLSNGVKVYIKKTDYKLDEVSLNGWGEGGTSAYEDSERVNLSVLGTAINCSGLNGFSTTDLRKVLSGKNAGCGISIGSRQKVVSGHSTPQDMETMFQLLHLNFTAMCKDTLTWNTWLENAKQNLKNRGIDPQSAFSDTVQANLHSNNVRMLPLTLEDVPQISYDRCMEMIKESFRSAEGFKFTVIGNYDEQKLREYLCQYVASLPVKGKNIRPKDRRTYFKGEVSKDFTRKMETPKPMVANIYYSKIDNSLENSILTTVTSEVLRMILTKSVREDAGATYTVGATGNLNIDPDNTYAIMQITAPISVPEKTDLAIQLMHDGLTGMASHVDNDMLNKVKVNMLKQHEVTLKRNSYWSGALKTILTQDIDKHTDYKATVEAVTPEKVSSYVKNCILKDGNHLRVVMRP